MDEIRKFVDTLIPAKLPKARKAELYAELEAHLYEKADFYMEIGYSRDESTKKAIDDFAADKDVQNSIFNEFEHLYRERTWWAFAAAGVVLAMNVLSFFSGNWIYSADFNEYPNAWGALVSFIMMFVLLFGIVTARVMQFRKTLIGIGAACLAVAGIMLWCFLPQVAFYTVSINLWYVIDRFTPFVVPSLIWESFFYSAFLFVVICAFYCFIEAFRIRRGKARTGERVWRKVAVFAAAYLAVTAVSCAMLPSAQRYEDTTRREWFNSYTLHITEKTEQFFDDIKLGDSYESARIILRSRGWSTIEEYESTLEREERKHFRADLKKRDFPDGYEIWYQPDRFAGDGYFALKSENGVVVSKGIGNVFDKLYYTESSFANFMYSDSNRNDDIKLMETVFSMLVQGAEESEVMGFFGTDAHYELGDMHGETYAKFSTTQNGSVVTYYRVHAYGLTDPYAKDYDRYNPRYFEFTFTDGALTEAKMYEKDEAYEDGVRTVTAF